MHVCMHETDREIMGDGGRASQYRYDVKHSIAQIASPVEARSECSQTGVSGVFGWTSYCDIYIPKGCHTEPSNAYCDNNLMT